MIMTASELKQRVDAGWPFFGIGPQGDVLARYLPFGPVFIWRRNRMVPLPLQGADLCWLLQAADEEAHALGDSGETAEKHR